ncbi:MAG: 2-hydroxyacid dehydrogenase [Tissierellia bacterium]|nr:2-hydroxyacid dehydrogenase [Tissierellia bacterium]
MKIAFFSTKPYDREAFEPLAEEMKCDIDYFEEKLDSKTVSLVKGYDATCSFVNDDLNSDVVQALRDSGVKTILLRCAGFDSVDLEKARELNMPVLRVPAYSPEAVAEFAVTLLLAVNRKVHLGYNRTKEFNFDIDGLRGNVLKGRTAGVIGTGRIGKATIDILRGFGMDIIAYDVYPDMKSDIKYVSLDELLSQSDVITLHTPLTPETKHIINSDSISKMKDGVILINTARGGLIKTEDLIKALEEDKFGGVGLDVCEQESDYFFEDKSHVINKDRTLQRLLSFDKLILTGHQAFFTEEAMNAIAMITLTNFKKFIEDGDLTNEVNLFLESLQE